jgi:hypothetical protein
MENALSVQNKLAELIHSINNIELLNAVYSFLKNNKEEGSITKEQLIQRALISEEDIKYGRLTSLEDVIKESDNW